MNYEKLDSTIAHSLWPWVRPEELSLVVRIVRQDILALGKVEPAWQKVRGCVEPPLSLVIPLDSE